jgi:hypothetical protein
LIQPKKDDIRIDGRFGKRTICYKRGPLFLTGICGTTSIVTQPDSSSAATSEFLQLRRESSIRE